MPINDFSILSQVKKVMAQFMRYGKALSIRGVRLFHEYPGCSVTLRYEGCPTVVGEFSIVYSNSE